MICPSQATELHPRFDKSSLAASSKLKAVPVQLHSSRLYWIVLLALTGVAATPWLRSTANARRDSLKSFDPRANTRQADSRLDEGNRRSRSYRNAPLSIAPRPGFERCVGSAQLATVAGRVVPTWDTLKIGSLVHALRVWGADPGVPCHEGLAPYPSALRFSPIELYEVLLDHRQFRAVFPGEAPLLWKTPYGIRVRVWPSWSGDFAGQSGHIDDLLSACAEIGLPLSSPVKAADCDGTILDLLHDSVLRFQWDQELEWTLDAFARYLPPNRTWVNRFGERFSFDKCCRRLLEQPIGRGACYGTHTPYTLAVVLACDEQIRILSEECRMAVQQRLEQVATMLHNSQRPNGAWDSSWASGMRAQNSHEDSQWVELTVTGHMLEWLAYAPASCCFTPDDVRRAVEYLHHHIQSCSDHAQSLYYLPHSHAVRGMLLLSGNCMSRVVPPPRQGEN